MVRSIDIFYIMMVIQYYQVSLGDWSQGSHQSSICIMMVIQYYQGSLGDRSRGSHQSSIDIFYIITIIQYYQGSLGGDHKVFTGIKGE